MHLGHYKACYAPHSHTQDTPECKEFEDNQQQILNAHLQLLNYAINHGYSFDRWKRIVTMMTEKELGNHKIHQLRGIHICAADYNLLLCVKWRSAVHHAMKSKILNPCQKEGTPGNSAPDVVFVEELEYEICRTTRTL